MGVSSFEFTSWIWSSKKYRQYELCNPMEMFDSLRDEGFYHLNESIEPFEEEDISKIKFDDQAQYDVTRTRLVCKAWVETTIPKLTNLWENQAVPKVCVIGPPPKLFRSTLVMPVKTHEPCNESILNSVHLCT